MPTGKKTPEGEDEVVTIRFDGAAEYANYQISRDPTQFWALVATTVMLGSLVGSLLIKRRRIWVRFVPVTEAASGAANGEVNHAEKVRVEIAGLARTDRAGWGGEFDDVVEEILRGPADNGVAEGSDGAEYVDDEDGEEWH